MFQQPFFAFVSGTIFGAYVSQNYNVPDIKQLIQTLYHSAKVMEIKMRKED